MELWPGIHSLDASRLSNAYLVTGPTPTLVDTGPPGTLPALLSAMRRAGVAPESLRRIVLTHCDRDHTGNARALQRIAGAQVCVHEDDAPYVEGLRQLPGLRRLINATMFRNVPAPRIDRLVRDGDDLDGLTVVHLPGHTPGHIGLQRGRALFAGDALRGGRRLREMPPLVTWDREAARRSIARIATLDVDLLMPGHGTAHNDGAQKCQWLVTSGE